MPVIVIVILVIIVLLLLVYNVIINKRIQEYKNINQKIKSLNVLQEFMNAIGEDETVDNKITKINNILIEQYNIKYSTIVAFDGAEYIIKATNVSEKHWDTMKNLHSEEIFKDSVTTATPKYITINNENEKLPYQKLEFGRAKSAIFFPLYIDNIYIGYWIIESGQEHAFDNLDTTILEVVKDNIVSTLKTVAYQSVVENLPRKDLYSELTTSEYLYGKGKRIIDKYATSTVCMFRIVNLEQINKEANRETGNDIIREVSKFVRNSISTEYLFVRYMGPKFVIVFSGVDAEGTIGFLRDLKKGIEDLKIKILEEKHNIDEYEDIEYEDIEEEDNEEGKFVKPKVNIVLTTYYKGTALDSVNKKLEEYLDDAGTEESEINEI